MSASTLPTVGFVGLGNQGGPIARRIVDGGFPLRVWARRPQSLEAVAGTAAVAMPTVVGLGEACDIVGVCVLADQDVLDITISESGLLRGMKPGSVLLIHSTVSPETCAMVAEIGTACGVEVLDAPVSGGADRAVRGEMAVMCGGASRDAFERCVPTFRTWARSIEFLGPIGSGQRAKLVNNAVFAANLGVAASALDVGVAAGVDRDALLRVLLGSSGSSFAAQVSAGGASNAGRAAALLRKDIGLFAAMVPEPLRGGLAESTASRAVAWLEERAATES